MTQVHEVIVDGRSLRLSNLDKVLYPEAAFTKAGVIDYYRRISDLLLPHLRGRPLTLKRYPNGVAGAYFYEKECPAHRPDWLRTSNVWSEGRARDIHYCVIEDLPALIWTVNLADLELHTFLSTVADLSRPTALVFDLDPGTPAGILECARVALLIKQRLERVALSTLVKTSGSKGLQVYAPLNTQVSYAATKTFARALADGLAQEHPGLIVTNMKRSLREGKVLIDWSQNDAHKTTVCVYSLRARSRPTVSTPLRWSEVRKAVAASDPTLLSFEYDRLLKRVRRTGDLFAPLLTEVQELPDPARL